MRLAKWTGETSTSSCGLVILFVPSSRRSVTQTGMPYAEKASTYPHSGVAFIIHWQSGPNGSEKINKRELQKVRDIYGAESVQVSFAKKSLEALWEGLCKIADSDDDQLISIEVSELNLVTH